MMPNKSPVIKDKDSSFFSGILDIFDTYSSFIVIGLIILTVISLVITGGSISSLSSSISVTDDKVDTLSNDIDDINSNINSLESDVSSNTNDIKDIQSDIDLLKIRTRNITTMLHDISVLQSNVENNTEDISDMQRDINDLKNETSSAIDANINITFVYHSNQTGNISFCDMWVNLSGDGIREFMLSVKYPKTNITLVQSSSDVYPMIRQYLNGSYTDNCMLYWYEKTTSANFLFNVTWLTSVYNTTSLQTDNLVYNMRVNTHYIDDVNIMTKTI